MRPPTHDDPHAIPRNGTDVPWVDLSDTRAGDAGSWAAPPAPDGREERRSGRRDRMTATQPGM